MKRMAVLFGLGALIATIAVLVTGSGNYSPSNLSVERNVLKTYIADGSPRPPLPPSSLTADGSPRPPLPPATFDGSPRPPLPPVVVADGCPRPPLPPGLSA